MPSNDKNAPRTQPSVDISTLPAGQAMDLAFKYLVHRWWAPPPDLSRRPPLPMFWVANDAMGVSCAIMAALFDPIPLYPTGKGVTDEALKRWEDEEEQRRASVDSFMEHFREPTCWDFHHSIVWDLPNGGMSVTAVDGSVQPYPLQATLVSGPRGLDGRNPF